MVKMDKGVKSTVQNTAMLYILSFAKLVLPLVTIPYLTRILSTEAYGTVSYVRACMTYIQLIIDFGFILSSVKDIVNANGDKEKIGYIIGHTYLAKTLLIGASLLVFVVMCAFIPILKSNVPFALLNFISIAITAYMADFFFRGLEKMHIITIIFVIAKLISTSLTFALVISDEDLLMIPILDILSNLVSVFIGQVWIRKLGVVIRIKSIYTTFLMLKESFSYFISSMATTVFSVFNTLLIGIAITDMSDIAYWSICMQIVSSIQGLYSPITNGVYPYMVRERSLRFIHRVLCIIMPIVVVGCTICYVWGENILSFIGGQEYKYAVKLLRCFIPVLFFSFPAQLYGWPTLGAIGKIKEVSMSTIFVAVIQILGLLGLLISGYMTIYSVAILKCLVEGILLIIRMIFVYRNVSDFVTR